MKKINADDVRDDFWHIHEEFEYGENYFHGMVEGAELAGNPFIPILQIDDDFGWDTVWKLPNGKYILDDRNSGEPAYLTEEQVTELLRLVD